MDYRTYTPERAEKIFILILSGASLLVLGILFYDTPFLFILAPLAYFPAARAYSSVMAEKRRERLRNQFRDLLDSLSASFAGGRHMEEALDEAYRELSAVYEEDDEIMEEIRGMLKRMADGETDLEILSDFAERSGIEDIEMFVRVYGACRETGGDIISAMNDTSDMLGEKIKIENEIRAITKQKKSEGVVISVMPVMILVFLRAVSPEYVEVLYGNALGILLMTAAIIASLFSFYLIRRITEIEV